MEVDCGCWLTKTIQFRLTIFASISPIEFKCIVVRKLTTHIRIILALQGQIFGITFWLLAAQVGLNVRIVCVNGNAERAKFMV